MSDELKPGKHGGIVVHETNKNVPPAVLTKPLDKSDELKIKYPLIIDIKPEDFDDFSEKECCKRVRLETTKKFAKERVYYYLATSKGGDYVSNIAEKLDIDPKLVVKCFRELEEEKLIDDKKERKMKYISELIEKTACIENTEGGECVDVIFPDDLRDWFKAKIKELEEHKKMCMKQGYDQTIIDWIREHGLEEEL